MFVRVCWLAALTAVLLCAGDAQPLDQNQLARVVQQIINRFKPRFMSNGVPKTPMYSVAVSVPRNRNGDFDMSAVDNGNQVRTAILNCEVYQGQRVVAATLLRWPDIRDQCPDSPIARQAAEIDDLVPVHAEYRTLQHFDTLLRQDNKQDLLVLYVHASPCDHTCTNARHRRNILGMLNPIVRWQNYAVVFSKIFKPRDDTAAEDKLRGAIEAIANYQVNGNRVGLQHIYRCYRATPGSSISCTSCSSEGQITPQCYTDDTQEPYGVGRGQVGGGAGSQAYQGGSGQAGGGAESQAYGGGGSQAERGGGNQAYGGGRGQAGRGAGSQAYGRGRGQVGRGGGNQAYVGGRGQAGSGAGSPAYGRGRGQVGGGGGNQAYGGGRGQAGRGAGSQAYGGGRGQAGGAAGNQAYGGGRGQTGGGGGNQAYGGGRGQVGGGGGNQADGGGRGQAGGGAGSQAYGGGRGQAGRGGNQAYGGGRGQTGRGGGNQAHRGGRG